MLDAAASGKNSGSRFRFNEQEQMFYLNTNVFDIMSVKERGKMEDEAGAETECSPFLKNKKKSEKE